MTESNLNNVKELAQVNRILVSIFPPADIFDGPKVRFVKTTKLTHLRSLIVKTDGESV